MKGKHIRKRIITYFPKQRERFDFPANYHNISTLFDHKVNNNSISHSAVNFTKTKLLGCFVNDNVATGAKGNLPYRCLGAGIFINKQVQAKLRGSV